VGIIPNASRTGRLLCGQRRKIRGSEATSRSSEPRDGILSAFLMPLTTLTFERVQTWPNQAFVRSIPMTPYHSSSATLSQYLQGTIPSAHAKTCEAEWNWPPCHRNSKPCWIEASRKPRKIMTAEQHKTTEPKPGNNERNQTYFYMPQVVPHSLNIFETGKMLRPGSQDRGLS
jgi:hypothetical protein